MFWHFMRSIHIWIEIFDLIFFFFLCYSHSPARRIHQNDNSYLNLKLIYCSYCEMWIHNLIVVRRISFGSKKLWKYSLRIFKFISMQFIYFIIFQWNGKRNVKNDTENTYIILFTFTISSLVSNLVFVFFLSFDNVFFPFFA